MRKHRRALADINPAQRFLLVMTMLGVVLVAGLEWMSPYVALPLFGLWELFSFFLTTLRFTDGSGWQRSSFAISFIGGFLMMLLPVAVVLFQAPLFPPGGCFQVESSVRYVCWGTPIGDYYTTINEMILVGGVAVFGGLTYMVHQRLRIASATLLLSASVVFPLVILETQLPLVYALVSALTAIGGVFVLAFRRGTGARPTQPFAGEIFKVLTRRLGISVLLVVLLLGVVGGLWGYVNEATGGVGFVCDTPSANIGFAQNETVGVTNPSFVPLHAVWKVTYNYTMGLVYTDTESFDIPARGTAYPRFAFASLELQKGVTVNSTYPLVFSYERTYSALLWLFVQNGSAIYTNGAFSSVDGIKPC